jgi:hypothetical protein
MKTQNTFTASASAVLNPPAGGIGASVTMALPAVDPDNVALALTNNSAGAVFYQCGNAAVIPSGPLVGTQEGPASGCIQSGQTVLIETAAGEAANIGLCAIGGSSSITAARGTVTTVQNFA